MKQCNTWWPLYSLVTIIFLHPLDEYYEIENGDSDCEDYDYCLDELECKVLQPGEWPRYTYNNPTNCNEGNTCQLGSKCSKKGIFLATGCLNIECDI